MRLRVLPELGGVRLTDLRRPDLQELADGLLAARLDPSTIRTTFLPLRAIYRRAIARSEVALSPCTGLELPAVRGRERFASPDEAEALIAAVPELDRAIWATAMYAGMRLGELRALRVDDVDLAAGVIHVERGYDAVEGEIELKSGAGRRRVPIAAVLRDYLAEHWRAPAGPAPTDASALRVSDLSMGRSCRRERTRRGALPASSGSRRTSAVTPSPR